MDRKLDRRRLLKGSAALLGGAAASFSPGLAAFARTSGEKTTIQGQPTLTWYALDPEWGAGLPNCPISPAGAHQSTHACHACNSCHHHADNKLFPTLNAANQNRAHVGCKCLVIEGGELPVDVWEDLFGAQGNIERQQVDRRWDWVAEILEGDLGPEPGVYDFAHEAFRRVWERTDLPVQQGIVSRSWLWTDTLPFTDGLSEQYEEGPFGRRLVQYCDKSRMEITDPNADPNSVWYVTNGLLVVELVTGRMQVGHNAFIERQPAVVNTAGDPDDPDGPTYATFATVVDVPPLPLGSVIDQGINRAGQVVTKSQQLRNQAVTVGYIDQITNHGIAAPFWDFMNSSGPVYQDGEYLDALLFLDPFFPGGRPIAEPYWAMVRVAGVQQLVLIQCFERRVMTYTPQNEPNWRVEAGNVGRHYYAWRYASL
ncbi:hypothetical protein BH23CHL2_BH23CHL2_08980 [soil metagenome]